MPSPDSLVCPKCHGPLTAHAGQELRCSRDGVRYPVVDGIPQISVQELKRKLDAKEEVFVLDVREPHEHRIVNLGTSLIPVGDIERRASELADKKNGEIVVYCKAGVRSQKAALALKQAGFRNVSNLTGGILAWAEKIDPSMPKY